MKNYREKQRSGRDIRHDICQLNTACWDRVKKTKVHYVRKSSEEEREQTINPNKNC